MNKSEKDLAKETTNNFTEAKYAFHCARDDAMAAGELPERAINKWEKSFPEAKNGQYVDADRDVFADFMSGKIGLMDFLLGK